MTTAFLERLACLSTWRRGSQRAPHKPLLLLLALSEWMQGRRLLQFIDYAEPLGKLIREFGPPRRAVHPEYPFWRLQRDGVWTVTTTSSPRMRRSNTDPTRASLIACRAVGSFSDAVEAELTAHPEKVLAAVEVLLRNHFPTSVHEDIRAELGLHSPEPTFSKTRRDPRFRAAVLQAYGYRCAVCGFGLRLMHNLIGLEAAHIRWHQCGGPDETPNGVALCSLHHKLFDLGAFTFSPQCKVIVSDAVNGADDLDNSLLQFHNTAIAASVHLDDRPALHHIAWHRREVFQGTPRPSTENNGPLGSSRTRRSR